VASSAQCFLETLLRFLFVVLVFSVRHVVTEDDWVKFVVMGTPKVVPVRAIQDDLCRALKCDSPMVRFHHNYAVKSQYKHNVPPPRFIMLPDTLTFGRAVLDKHGHISFFYHDHIVYGGWFHASVKGISSRTELWLRTFHPIGADEVHRKTRRGTVLRYETRPA
jgi:hypothetical protein